MQSVTLIIDSRRELSTKYKKLLESKNNKCLSGKNLMSAMLSIQEQEPDLIIISDSIDGDLSDYCKKIRALTYNMRPIIVALSKSAELEDKLKVLENGADDFISEPVNSEEFTMRIKAHLRREFESNLDAKKLLPNKNYSMRTLKRVISKNIPWACLLVSVENFKNYKETYTELASDKLIQTYCAIIRTVLGENDYLGSLSTNEFLIITDQIKAEKLANFLIFAFNSVLSKFYSPQDNKRGFMLMQGDEFAGRRSDFINTTIGAVSNEFIQYNDPTQLMNALIQTHNLAKNPSKSNFLMERPKISAENAVRMNGYNKKIVIIETDNALSLLLETILSLQGYVVDIINDYDDFCLASGVPVIIILDAGTSETPSGLEICKHIRKDASYSKTKLIVTSVFHDKELILSLGADLYLPKPYELPNLIKWVQIFMSEAND